VTETLGAGTFGRVKQIVGPSKEVLALKQISKSHIINLKQVEHIKLEKRILTELNHPFIYSLKTAFQD
jgi:protein kinase X